MDYRKIGGPVQKSENSEEQIKITSISEEAKGSYSQSQLFATYTSLEFASFCIDNRLRQISIFLFVKVGTGLVSEFC